MNAISKLINDIANSNTFHYNDNGPDGCIYCNGIVVSSGYCEHDADCIWQQALSLQNEYTLREEAEKIIESEEGTL